MGSGLKNQLLLYFVDAGPDSFGDLFEMPPCSVPRVAIPYRPAHHVLHSVMRKPFPSSILGGVNGQDKSWWLKASRIVGRDAPPTYTCQPPIR